MAKIIKKKKKIKKKFIKTLQQLSNQRLNESGLSKQLLSNFRAENSCELQQLDAEVKDGVFY